MKRFAIIAIVASLSFASQAEARCGRSLRNIAAKVFKGDGCSRNLFRHHHEKCGNSGRFTCAHSGQCGNYSTTSNSSACEGAACASGQCHQPAK